MEYTFNLNEEDGRYYANIYCTDDRWRTRLSLLTTQKSVARQRLARWERMWSRGEWDPRGGRPSRGDQLPLKKAVSQFLAFYKEEVRERTHVNMRSTLSMLMESLGPGTPISHIRPSGCRRFIQGLSSHGDAPAGSAALSTKAEKHSKLVRFFSYFAERGVLKKSPMAPLSRPRVDDRATYEVLSPADATRLLRACKVEGGPRYWMQFVEVALSSGLRLGELRHLKWSRVDRAALKEMGGRLTEEDVCEIRVEPVQVPDGAWQPKNKFSHRSVLVYPRGAAVLRERWEEKGRPKDGFVFRERSRAWLQRRMKRYGEVAGLRPKREPTLHDCRHTWFSWLLNDLGLARKAPAISEMGGHGQIERTWNYVRAGEDAGRDAVYESLGLQAPEGREEDVRAFLTGAPMGAQNRRSEGVLDS